MILIGLHGLAGSGKDSVADHLVDLYSFEKITFAKPIKEAAAALFGIGPEYWEDRDRKEAVIPWLGKSPRQVAQLLGTEFGRHHFGNDVWIKVAKQHLDGWREEIVEQTFHPFCGAVVSDVRFEDEAAWVRSEGGVVWHIRRESAKPVSDHVSESGIEIAHEDIVIRNNGTLVDLYNKVDKRIAEYML